MILLPGPRRLRWHGGFARTTNAPAVTIGEATGHAHVATGEGLTLLCLPDDLETMFLHVRGYGRVSHEEHAAIPLPSGYYRVVRQREYEPGAIRYVAD